MSLPPSAASSPADVPGIAIRRAMPRDAGTIARARIDSWRTTYRGLIPTAYLDGMQVDASTALWDKVLTAGPNPASVFVASRADEVVGFAAGSMLGEPRFGLDAELTAVYLRGEFQRVGLGRRLIAAVVDAPRSHGATGMIVRTIAGNKPARSFYESLGAKLLIEQAFQGLFTLNAYPRDPAKARHQGAKRSRSLGYGEHERRRGRAFAGITLWAWLRRGTGLRCRLVACGPARGLAGCLALCPA
jgi:ribosomal protein S18 acetylase RimI-like enzyme